MFGFIKDKIKKVYSGFTQKVSSLFSRSKLDDVFLEDLSNLLISSDTGVKTTKVIIDELREQIKSSRIETLAQAKELLEQKLYALLDAHKQENLTPKVMLLVGVNGTGKTTFAAKFANLLKSQGKRVLLVAGDTFRAAATQQLQTWGDRFSIDVFVGGEQQDPASVIFDACKKYKDENYDHIIIDTAGRLQTKVNLMKELEKIRKIISRFVDEQDLCTWLTVDAMLGQNSLRQAQVFHEATKVNGVILTKLDGTGKGGVVFSIVEGLKLPIMYSTFGESIDDVKIFDPQEYVAGLLNE